MNRFSYEDISELVPVIVKHMAGLHDQSTHGHGHGHYDIQISSGDTAKYYDLVHITSKENAKSILANGFNAETASLGGEQWGIEGAIFASEYGTSSEIWANEFLSEHPNKELGMVKITLPSSAKVLTPSWNYSSRELLTKEGLKRNGIGEAYDWITKTKSKTDFVTPEQLVAQWAAKEGGYDAVSFRNETIIFPSKNISKHMAGLHDQSTHAGGHSIKSIDDLVKNASSLQKAIDILDEQLGSRVAKGNTGMRVLLEHLKKGGVPEKVTSIDELAGKPMYRGMTVEQANEEITSPYSRVGMGTYGDGYYFSSSPTTADIYATNATRWSPSKKSTVVVAGWKKDAKVMHIMNDPSSKSKWSAYDKHMEAAKKVNDAAVKHLKLTNGATEADYATHANFYDSSERAYVTHLMLQGYDGLEIEQPFDGETHTIVFNRGALQVVGN